MWRWSKLAIINLHLKLRTDQHDPIFDWRLTPMAEVAQQKVSEIRPFRVDIPEAQLTDLRRRINATIWPEQENDPSQGVALKTIQALARYWGTDYDWRKCEGSLNALPNLI